MSKQEEIMEELPKILEGVWDREDYDNVWIELAKVALEYIQSRGGVLTVERELPEQNNYCVLWDLYRKGWLESQQAMRLAGYEAVGPLEVKP